MYSPSSPRKNPFGSAKNSPRRPLLSPSEKPVTPFTYSSNEALNLFNNEQLQQTSGRIPLSSSTPHSLPLTPRPRSGSAGARINLKLGLSNLTSSEATASNSSMASGIVPMHGLQNPKTPEPMINVNQSLPYETKPNFFRYGKSMSFGGGGGSLNERVNQSMSSGLGSSSSGSSLLTMREYDETMRDLRKENFNLKLRIYFLEERLGTARLVAAAGSKEELVQNNIELKVTIESLRYDIKEKTELLQEASNAIEALEKQISTMAVEREEERSSLEDKLKQLEEDLGDQTSSILFGTQLLLDHQNSSNNRSADSGLLGSSQENELPNIKLPSDKESTDDSFQSQEFHLKKENESSNSDEQEVNNLEKKGVNVPKIEDDERLLSEVEAEMARGVAIPAKISSAQQTTPITGPVIPITQSSSLEVVEEKDEAIVGRLEDLEENVDRLNQIIRDTELCLQQAQDDVTNRMEHIEALEKELLTKNEAIEELRKEKQLKAEETVKAQLELASLSEKSTEQYKSYEGKIKDMEIAMEQRKQTLEKLEIARDDLTIQLRNLEQNLQEKDLKVEDLVAELLDKNDRIKQLNEVLQKKSASNLCNNCKKAILDGGSLNNDATSSDLLDPSSHVKTENDEHFTVYSSTPIPRTRSSSCSSKDTIIAPRKHHLNNPNLQIVTQALHIPPKLDGSNDNIEDGNEAHSNEVERLRRDMRKLKDYLKTSVQERKMLVKKIGTLNDRVAAAHVRKSVSPEKSTMTDSSKINVSFEDRSFEDHGIQCTLLNGQEKVDQNFDRFASELQDEIVSENATASVPAIVNNLNMSQEAVAKLESILLENEDCKEKFISLLENIEASSDTETRNCYRLNVTNVTNCYKRRSCIEPDQFEEKSRMSSECLEDNSISGVLFPENQTGPNQKLNQHELQSCSSMTSSLPDPNMIDLMELSFDNASTSLQGITVEPPSILTVDNQLQPLSQHDESLQLRRLNQDMDRKRRDLEHKTILLETLEDQNKEKDKIIRDQADVLEEYRMEILRLRDERRDMNSGRLSSSQQQYQNHSKKRPPPRKNFSNESQQQSNNSSRNRPNQATFENNTIGNQSLAKALSEEEDSWSEPDVSASRKRMGISQHVLSLLEKNNKRLACADSSEIEEQQKDRLKSYYSLGVMGHDSYPEEYNDQNQGDNFGLKDENNIPENLKVEDYSRIIKELQSHRKEIEKLQLDMNGSSLKETSSSAPVTGSSKARFSNDEFFPFCPLDELHHQLEDIIDDDVSGKEDYLTAEDSYIADQDDYDDTNKQEEDSSSSPQSCPLGSLKCLLTGLNEFSRTMNELEYQLDLSDTLDSGNVTGHENDEVEIYGDQNKTPDPSNVIMLSESDATTDKIAKHFDDFHVQLCEACSSSLPLELENCLHRCGGLLAGSTYSLHRLRRLCCRYRKRVKFLSNDLMSKQLQINQLQDNMILLRQKADKTDDCLREMAILKEDIQNKNNELACLQDKLNENYRLVAGLSSENLKLSSEKLKADDVVNEVIKEQARLKQELQKAVQVVDAMRDSDISTAKKQNMYSARNKRNNTSNNSAFRPYNINIGQSMQHIPQHYNPRSSPDTSSSFDFYPNMIHNSIAVSDNNLALESSTVLPNKSDSGVEAAASSLDTPLPIIPTPESEDISYSRNTNINNNSNNNPMYNNNNPSNSLSIASSPKHNHNPNKSPRGRHYNNSGRGSNINRRGSFNRRWRGPGYSSDYQPSPINENNSSPGRASEYNSRYKHANKERGNRPQSTLAGGLDDISSPDLGVDVGSDPFSSLERRDIPAPVNLLVEENKRLRSDNEKLISKLTQSKGVLKDTLDRLATNNSNETTATTTTTSSKDATSTKPILPTASRTRIFSQAINACQLDKQIASITQKERRSNLKEEFLEFSRTHSSPKKPSGKRGNHRNISPTKHSHTTK